MRMIRFLRPQGQATHLMLVDGRWHGAYFSNEETFDGEVRGWVLLDVY